MNKKITKFTSAYKVEIFMGGDYEQALDACALFCDKVGLCVTVEKTCYVFKGGRENGVRVGLINYARFPKDHYRIWETAADLAAFLKDYLVQGSYTIQDSEDSLFISTRDEDQ